MGFIQSSKIALIGNFPAEGQRSLTGPEQVCRGLRRALSDNEAHKFSRVLPLHKLSSWRNKTSANNSVKGQVVSALPMDIIRELISGQYRVVHLLGLGGRTAWPILFFKKSRRFSVVYTAHGVTPLERALGYSHRRTTGLIEWLIVRKADVVVPVSSVLKELMLGHFGLGLLAKMKVIHNGVDMEYFGSGEGDHFRAAFGIGRQSRILLAAGGTWELKGMRFLIRSFTQLHDNELMLVIAGPEGNEHGAVMELAQENANIRYVGLLSQDMLRDAYHAADIYIQSSMYDSFPSAPLEAMAAGCPVVVTDRVGTRDLIINKSNGLVVGYGNTEALADAIRLLLSNPNLHHTIAQNAKQTALKLTWFEAAKHYSRLYSELCSDNPIYL